MNENILELVKKYLDKDARNNGTCASITIEELKNAPDIENKIEEFVSSICYTFNSAKIRKDDYGIERLILFNL